MTTAGRIAELRDISTRTWLLIGSSIHATRCGSAIGSKGKRMIVDHRTSPGRWSRKRDFTITAVFSAFTACWKNSNCWAKARLG